DLDPPRFGGDLAAGQAGLFAAREFEVGQERFQPGPAAGAEIGGHGLELVELFAGLSPVDAFAEPDLGVEAERVFRRGDESGRWGGRPGAQTRDYRGELPDAPAALGAVTV